MVLCVFFPCYLFCIFVCYLLLAMLHVYIYREKHSCCGPFICSRIFSVRTGKVNFYNFTQFYASSSIKIEKKTQNPNKRNHFCWATGNDGKDAVPSRAKSRQGVARSGKENVWEASHEPFFWVCSPTNRWPGDAEELSGAGLGWDCRDIWRDMVTTDTPLLRCWIKDKNLTGFCLELIGIKDEDLLI